MLSEHIRTCIHSFRTLSEHLLCVRDHNQVLGVQWRIKSLPLTWFLPPFNMWLLRSTTCLVLCWGCGHSGGPKAGMVSALHMKDKINHVIFHLCEVTQWRVMWYHGREGQRNQLGGSWKAELCSEGRIGRGGTFLRERLKKAHATPRTSVVWVSRMRESRPLWVPT